MAQIIQILFGAWFTVGLAMALGWIALRLFVPHPLADAHSSGRSRVVQSRGGDGAAGARRSLECLSRMESALLAFVLGSAVLSLATFGLCAVGQARGVVFLSAGIPAMAWATWLWWRGSAAQEAAWERVPLIWEVLFYSGIALFAIIYFFNALAPEVSPDGSGYHLGNVLRMIERHGFAWDYHSIYAYFPQGMEMLFLVAVSLGGLSSAALVHVAFLLALPLLMSCFGRRLGFPRAAMGAGLVVFASPVVGIDGASAYNDVALATMSFAVFYCAQLLDEEFSYKVLLMIGLLAGFCFGIKYTGALALPLALWWCPRGRRSLWVLAGAAISAGPWIARNWIWLGNPVAPFLNRWFPNPYYYPGPEQSYVADLRHYEMFHHWWQAPIDMAVSGGSIPGIVGPVFLLAPLAVLAMRNRHGRRMLLAAAVWAIPVWFNSGSRFLIPALPFLALAMGMALENSWGALPAVAVFQLWACWPSTLAAYAAPWSWRIRDVPVQAALRREPEAEFLASRLPDYVFKAAIDREVKPSEKIFSYAGRPEAYLDRTVVVGYESALGLLTQSILAHGLSDISRYRFDWGFDGRPANAIRFVTHNADPRSWAVPEIHIWDQHGEVRPEGWRVSASPNPWQARLAFDESPVTSWCSWQPLKPGFWIEAEFPKPLSIARITLESTIPAYVQLQVAVHPGQWQTLRAGEDVMAPPRDLRKESIHQLKTRGIFYLLLNDSDPPSQDMKKNPNLWGVTLIQEAHGTRFYRIQ